MLGFIKKHPIKSILAVALGATAAVVFAFALPVIFAGAISTAAVAAATTVISLAVTGLVYGVGRLFGFIFSQEREVRYLIDSLETPSDDYHDNNDNDNDNEEDYIEDDYLMREPTSTNPHIPKRPVDKTEVKVGDVDETEIDAQNTRRMSY